MKPSEQVVVSILTPSGRGAVAVIAIEGQTALSMVERYFRAKATPLAERDLNRIAYGRWGEEPAEDVIACRRGADSVEVHCHGGIAAAKRIVSDLTVAGAVEAAWPRYVERHETSPVRAAARIELSKAVTERTALVLLDQYHGALEHALRIIVENLGGGRLDAAKLQIETLLARASVGLHLTQPWRIVIAGPPNAGKSSLINALLGYERAIVFDQPGTTRDVVTAQTAFGGWPVQLADTAGLRESDDPLESAGIERAEAQATAADCLMLVFDASQPWTAGNDLLIQNWPQALIVHNKCDLVVPTAAGLKVSAFTGDGIDRLIQAIISRLVLVAPLPQEAVPFTTVQVEALQIATEHIRRGNVKLAQATLKDWVG
jgi:tRNA modification GTPase